MCPQDVQPPPPRSSPVCTVMSPSWRSLTRGSTASLGRDWLRRAFCCHSHRGLLLSFWGAWMLNVQDGTRQKNCFVQNTECPCWGDVPGTCWVERQTSPWPGFAICRQVLFLHFPGCTSGTTRPNDRAFRWSVQGPAHEQNRLPFHLLSDGSAVSCWEGRAWEPQMRPGQASKGWLPYLSMVLFPFPPLDTIFFCPLISQVLYYSRVPRVLSE